jgi:hypothetical protein
MQKNIQMVNFHIISDVMFDVTEFKADQQVREETSCSSCIINITCSPESRKERDRY